jgi:hypothetical protein
MAEDEARIERALARYQAALHAVQSGVAAEMDLRPGPTEPKHLRTGVNAAMADHAGLVTLLIAKGVITKAEYYEAMANAMEEEKARYEQHLSNLMGGVNVSLG